MKKKLSFDCLLVLAFLLLAVGHLNAGTLKVNAKNWRYFDNETGKAVYLVSSHTWMVTVDSSGFSAYGWDLNKWKKYLDFLKYWNLNFIRMWAWEHDTHGESFWVKTSSGKFDLTRFNQAYFDKVYSFVKAAEERHVYVGVMLFQGWSGALSFQKANFKNWTLHPMNANNNINGIDGDPGHRGYGSEIHNRSNKIILPYWEAYVRKMVDTLNGFDNIFWEIGNEDPYPPFARYFIDFIHDYEKGKLKQHLVWYSSGGGTGNANVYSSNADVFSPEDENWGERTALFFRDPPPVSHDKPEILDNDHVGNHTTPITFSPLDQRNWTWKAFLRGYHPLHMDSYDTPVFYKVKPSPNHPMKGVSTSPLWDPQRKSLGDTLRFADKMRYLVETTPTTDTNICSTGYCLYSVGKEYLAYQPLVSGSITLDLAPGSYKVETFDTTDSSTKTTQVKNWTGGKRTFQRPSHVREDWVLYVFRE
ncbi:MAG: hypothetical protein AB1898_27645 [Acidobacteriota bacterium]